MENKLKKLILDYSKWRCGDLGPNMLGQGETMLLNKEGFQCCLGLWSAQLGATESKLLGTGDPSDLEVELPLFNKWKDGIDAYDNRHSNTELSYDCVGINDQIATTPEEKIIALTERLAKEGIKLEVINKPV